MLIRPVDRGRPDEWRRFLGDRPFGHLVAAGRDREFPVVVPTQFVLDGDHVWLHLARPNPVWAAIEERPAVVLSVAGDWSYIPSAWKAIGDEDPRLGVPTTYYAAVQLRGTATIVDDASEIADLLVRQLEALQPDVEVVPPSEHGPRLAGIRGLRVHVAEVDAKFKFGGNVDEPHRRAVAERLVERDGPGDRAARAHLLRRLAEETRLR